MQRTTHQNADVLNELEFSPAQEAVAEEDARLEASRLSQQAIATSVPPPAAPTGMPEAALTEEPPTKERTKFNKTNEIRTYLLSHLYARICICARACLHARISIGH